jgi:transposase
MQGKVKPVLHAMEAVYVGIDVCKDRLDVHIHPADTAFAVANDAGGWRALKRRLARYTVERVVMEATSKFHRAAHRSLAAAGYGVAIVNPLRARLFAEAIGKLAKTDGVDARMLALMACQITPDATAPASQTLESMAEMAHARRKLVEQRTAIMLQHGSTACRAVRSALADLIKALEKTIARLEDHIAKTIQSDAGLARRYAILTSIPSIGPVIASTLIVTMAELGSIPDKQITALAGLAPFADDSGPRSGKRHIRGGRPDARQALYQAALVAARYNPQLKDVYLRLTAAGKAKKVALIAVARKLLILANTLIQENRPWEPRHA